MEKNLCGKKIWNERKKRMRRGMGILLAAAVVFNTLPLGSWRVSASENQVRAVSESRDVGICEHHLTHTADCGYIEEHECCHEHADECYQTGTECVHAHTEDCETEGCSHLCTEKSGCISRTLNCQHEHDGNCSYAAAHECAFICGICGGGAAKGEDGIDDSAEKPETDGGAETNSGAELNGEAESGKASDRADENTEECVCEALCTEDNRNRDCPVCCREDASLSGCKGIGTEMDDDARQENTDIDADTYTPDAGFCAHHKEHTADCGYSEEEGIPCGYECRICVVEDLIAVLPDEVDGDNADEVALQLEQILGLYAELTEEEQEQIDMARCYELQKALDTTKAPVSTANESASGNFGENNEFQWSLDETGILTITGSGNMPDFSPGSVPWAGNMQDIIIVKIGENVTSIGGSAFSECSNLVSAELPECITVIGMSAFSECSKLRLNKLPNNLVTIEANAFLKCTSLQMTSLPSEITTIGGSAFQGCTNLSLSSLPTSVTSIGAYAFSNCSRLSLSSLPDSVSSIGQCAFDRCVNIALSKLPAGLKSIEASTFNECTKLALTELPAGLTSIGNYAFYGCTGIKMSTLPESVRSIGKYAFEGCSNLALTKLPDNLTIIREKAFEECPKLALTELPAGLTSIENYAFFNCKNIKLTKLPDTVEYIGNRAFAQCDGLVLKELPDGVKTIEAGAFRACPNIEQIKLPSSLESIGDVAFAYCSKLTKVICERDTAPTLKDQSVFSNSPVKIYIPARAQGYTAENCWPIEKIEYIKIPVTPSIQGDTAKPYDGTADVSDGQLSIKLEGLVEGDDVTVTADFAYDSFDVGENKIITASNITLSGANAEWYQLSVDTVTTAGTITKGDKGAPSAPTAAEGGITWNSVTLDAIADAEYSMDGTNWQDSPVFSGLSPNTEYTFYARLKENANYKPSPSSSVQIATHKAPLETAQVTVSGDYVYDGTAQIPAAEEVTVVLDGNIVAPGQYIITAANNINAGTAALTITAAPEGNYSGTASGEFQIKKAVPDIGTVTAEELSDTLDISKVVLNRTDETVAGALSLTDTVLKYGTHAYTWNFTPTDQANYNQSSGTVEITVKDTIMPTAEYQIDTDEWKEFLNKISFGLFYKDYITVRIRYMDEKDGVEGSGVADTGKQYYISDREITEPDSIEWKTYTGDISLDAGGTYLVYAKATDRAGNTAVYNNEGMVIYKESSVTPAVYDYTYKQSRDCVVQFDLNGNTLQELTDEDGNVISTEHYTVGGDGRLTLKASYLDTLRKGEYKYKAAMNPQGMETDQVELVCTFTVRILAKELTIESAAAADRDYDGTDAVEITAVTLSGAAPEDDVAVELSGIRGKVGSADAGTYTSVTLSGLTLGGADSDNYTLPGLAGSIPTSVTIHPLDAEITGGTEVYNKVYGDGPFSLDITDDNPEADVQYEVTDGEDVISVTNGTVTINNAGKATIKASLPASANYNAAEGSVIITVSVAQKSGFTAEKVERRYCYVMENTETIDLAPLLPNDCGTAVYAMSEVSGNVAYSAEPAVNDGKLSYTTRTGNIGDEGTIAVTVATRNYTDIVVTVKVKLTDRMPVSLKADTKVTLRNNTLTYGETLSKLTFHDAEFVDSDGNTVKGTLAWKEPETMPVAGTGSAVWVFTPENQLYLPAEGTAAITVNKAPNAPNMPEGKRDVPKDFEKVSDVALPDGWEWQEPDALLKAGEPVDAVAVYNGPDKGNYEKETVTVSITKEKPTDDQPGGDEEDAGKPFIKGDDGKKGWDVIRAEEEKAGEDSTIHVDMNGTAVVPGDIFDRLKGRDITITFDMGSGILWSVDGKGILTEKADDIDFSVKTGENTIPVDIVNNITGERYSVQLSLAYDGKFGFTAVLSMNLGKENRGLAARLYYYNTGKGKLELQGVDKVAEDGTISFPFTHASEYVIVLGEKEDGSDNEGNGGATKPIRPAQPAQSEQPAQSAQPESGNTQNAAETKENNMAVQESPKTGQERKNAYPVAAGGIILAGAAIAAILAQRKKKDETR